MPISRWLNEFEDCKQSSPKTPFIVPPSWNKTEHHRLITPVWKAAAEALSKAEYIIVIGYSFPGSDAFFHYLYGLGSLGKNPLRKFIVFNPDTNEVEGRFRKLLGKAAEDVFAYEAVDFKQAIKYLWSYFSKG